MFKFMSEKSHIERVKKMILGIISGFLGLLGVYGFFAGYPYLVIIGGISGIIENFIGVTSKQQKSLSTVVVAIILAFIFVGRYFPWWFTVLIAITFESALMALLGLLFIAFMSFKR